MRRKAAPEEDKRTFLFSDAKIKSLKVSEGRKSFYDTNVTGLGVRVSHTGRKVWELFYRVGDDPRSGRMDFGKYPALELAEAREKARELLNLAAKGIDPAGKKRAHKEAPTFGSLADEYIKRYAKVLNPATGEPRKRSWKKDEDAIKRDLLPYWEKRKAVDIKKRDVNEVLDRVAARAPIQANRTLALIRKIFNWGISRDIVEVNPAAQIKAPSVENERDRALSDAEIRAFWKACGSRDPIIAGAFRMRLITGQRGGEVDSMNWGDIEGEWWTIPAGRAKNKREHRVPLAARAIALLDEMKALNEARETASAWVFPSRMKKGDGHLSNPHVSARKMLEAVGEILEEQEIAFEAFTLHDLRRTVASNMAELGVDEALISRVLNHKEPGAGVAKVTRVYNRYKYDKEKREALETWAARLEEILEAKEGASI